MSAEPLPRGALGLMFRGFHYPFAALGVISRHRLWHVTLGAIAVNVVLLVALVIGSFWVAIPWLHGLDVWLHNLSDMSWLQGLLGAVAWLAWIIGAVLLIALDALLLLLVGQAVASPVLDMLSEKVEEAITGEPGERASAARIVRSAIMALSDLVWSLVFWVVVQIPLVLIGLIPMVGTVIASVLSFAFSAILLSHEFVGMPAGRRLWPYRRRFGIVWRNKSLSLGFGSAAMALMLVPGLNLMLLPLVTVGGTVAYCDLKAAGRLEPRLS